MVRVIFLSRFFIRGKALFAILTQCKNPYSGHRSVPTFFDQIKFQQVPILSKTFTDRDAQYLALDPHLRPVAFKGFRAQKLKGSGPRI